MKGWECPKCGRCYAPAVSECGACAPMTTMVVGSPYVTITGTRCYRCGIQTREGLHHECSTGTALGVAGGTLYPGLGLH